MGILPDGKGGLYDFQLTRRCNWSQDVHYYIATSMRTETRRKEERGLLEHYLKELQRHGVPASQVPSFEEAWLRYRRALIWGLVIGWLICPPQNYGIPINLANITRLVAAMVDH